MTARRGQVPATAAAADRAAEEERAREPKGGGGGSSSPAVGTGDTQVQARKNFAMWPEAAVASALGLTREEVRQIRRERLERGEDWQIEDGSVMWARSALDRVADFGMAAKSAAPTLEALYALVSAAAEQMAKSAEIPPKARPAKACARLLPLTRRYPNPRLVEVRDGSMLLRVRVRSSRLLLPGMLLPVEPDGHGGWLCRRLPRRRGKW